MHVTTENCLADCLTKANAKATNLVDAVNTGKLLFVDCHPPFPKMLQHKAYLDYRMFETIPFESQPHGSSSTLDEDISPEILTVRRNALRKEEIGLYTDDLW